MKKGKKNRRWNLSVAETLTLHQLYCDLHRPKIFKMEMEGKIFEVVAHVDLRDPVPVKYVKEQLARKLAEAMIANDVVKIDVVDDSALWGEKLLRGTLRVVVPKGVF
ncbi:MAG: hypothetical protein J6V38_07840 [Kiritimatiellae bacterium]|nr:hypothetical protein [Kiritimatiellia bacterium]